MKAHVERSVLTSIAIRYALFLQLICILCINDYVEHLLDFPLSLFHILPLINFVLIGLLIKQISFVILGLDLNTLKKW